MVTVRLSAGRQILSSYAMGTRVANEASSKPPRHDSSQPRDEELQEAEEERRSYGRTRR